MTRIILQSGAHASLDEGGCAMEFVAWAAGEPHSDHPACVCPVIGEFCRSWNDALDDTDRQRLVPHLLNTVGTNTGPADAETRAWMCVDWLARVQAPAWLRLAGLTDHARALEGLARIADTVTADAARSPLDAARDAAWAAAGAAAAAADAWAAARDAAGAAAAAAAGATARDAAWAAARATAWATARDAAWAADAWAAARDADAGAALAPTVAALQESAFALLDAMCAVGRVSEPEMVPERRDALLSASK